MSKLAINGGTKVAPDGLKTTWPIFGDLEEKYVLETLRSGENRISDPELAELYESLSILTRGELWSWERLREIAQHL